MINVDYYQTDFKPDYERMLFFNESVSGENFTIVIGKIENCQKLDQLGKTSA